MPFPSLGPKIASFFSTTNEPPLVEKRLFKRKVKEANGLYIVPGARRELPMRDTVLLGFMLP